MIEIDYLEEPKLQFGSYFEHQDTKIGLAEFGPFGRNVDGLHPSEIKLGFIGTTDTISGAQDWIGECGSEIESQNVKTVNKPKPKNVRLKDGLFVDEEEDEQVRHRFEKILNRDFVGFNNTDSKFNCRFLTNARWDHSIQSRELDKILDIMDSKERIRALVDRIDAEVESLASTSPAPDVIVVALTERMYEEAARARVAGNFYLDFRRAIKARAMKWQRPIQLIRPNTVTGKGEMQEKATRAWNFCTAQYYKAEGVPWRPTTLDADTLFVGISFYVTQDMNDRLTMRSSLAQAFDCMGQGLVLRGDPFEWDIEKMGRSPHLTYDAAFKLMNQTIAEYKKVNRRLPPKRVVIHKTSEFWGNEHPDYNELDGLQEGILAVNPDCDIDLVALRRSKVRLFREGSYPPLRGTYFSVGGDQHFLYTMGYIPYLETYPGSYVPEAWQITKHYGDTPPKQLCREILALTKMNVNNCAFADSRPITLSFSQMIGEIMKHIPENGDIQPHPHYRFYM